MKKLKKIIASALTSLIMMLLAAQGAYAGTIEDIQKRGKIIIGLSTFVPWAMRAKNGDIIGFEIDVGRGCGVCSDSLGRHYSCAPFQEVRCHRHGDGDQTQAESNRQLFSPLCLSHRRDGGQQEKG